MDRFVIAITRTYGSGAKSISQLLAKDYNIPIYDKELLRLASEDSGINERLFEEADEKIQNTLLYKIARKVYKGELIPPESNDFESDHNLFNYQAKVLKELAENESYICIGRAADYILKDFPHVFKIFIYAPEVNCITKEMNRTNCTREEAKKTVNQIDKFRSEYYKYHTGREWMNPCNYDLCLNTGNTSYAKCAEIIKAYIKEKMKEE